MPLGILVPANPSRSWLETWRTPHADPYGVGLTQGAGCSGPWVSAQYGPAVPFELELLETTIPAVPGLHSFAFAQQDGRWLFVGGRTNGLHGFAVNPFPNAFANDNLWVIDPTTRAVWSATLDALPDNLADPLPTCQDSRLAMRPGRPVMPPP